MATAPNVHCSHTHILLHLRVSLVPILIPLAVAAHYFERHRTHTHTDSTISTECEIRMKLQKAGLFHYVFKNFCSYLCWTRTMRTLSNDDGWESEKRGWRRHKRWVTRKFSLFINFIFVCCCFIKTHSLMCTYTHTHARVSQQSVKWCEGNERPSGSVVHCYNYV